MKLISKKELGPRHVFDIEVDQVHNFYADGVNVHNCATAGGVSVIKHNGTVVNSGNTGTIFTVAIDAASFLWCNAGNSGGYLARSTVQIGSLQASWAFSFYRPDNIANAPIVTLTKLVQPTKKNPVFLESATQVGMIQQNQGALAKSLYSKIANTYNTGHQPGDIRRTYLSDNVVESVGPSTELVTNGTFDTSDTSIWTLTSGSYSLAVSDGQLVITNLVNTGDFGGAYAVITGLTIGRTYFATFSMGGSAPDKRVYMGSSTTPFSGTEYGGNASGPRYFTAVSTTLTIFPFSNGWGAAGLTITFDNVSVKEYVHDRSYKSQRANITGTLTKSAVASAAELVAYSGFSAANYLREPYSADLDFGTGEWTCSAWINDGHLASVSTAYSGFAPISANLVPNGTFDTDTSGWTGTNATLSVQDGALRIQETGGGEGVAVLSGFTPVIGRTYRIELDRVAGSSGAVNLGGVRRGLSAITGNHKVVYVTASTTGPLIIATDVASGAAAFVCDNITLHEVGPALIADRSHSSGARISLGVTATGLLTATAFDGTTTRTVTTAAAYNTGTWIKAEADYTTDGTLAISVNGVEVAATRGNPLLTLNNSNAVLTIGNSYNLDAPFPGSIALLKLSATVPTPEQSVWMYEQEKQLFRAGAKCCLPDAGAIVDLTYDDATDKWIAVSATNESEWSGLVRTSVTPVPAGSYTRAVARSGIQMLARSTTSPGVDITIPAYGLREELVNRAEAAARLNAQLATYDYVGGFTANTTNGNTAIVSVANLTYPTSYIGARVSGSGIPANTTIVAVSGTTIYLSAAATATATGVQISFVDFILPVGMEAKEVSLAGAAQREGATAQFTRLFDGFKETIRFGTAPSHTALIQIQATRSAA